jgi:2-oxoglutarate ferredoxin oxidoreductase subunit beta
MNPDPDLEPRPRLLVLQDYVSLAPRWCPGCGDHGVLGAIQRLARDEQLPPEQTVIVSGIGCSSRFPHYMKTYGFHGLHGRPLPVACGVRSRRDDLHVFVVTGDGDCCAIGTAHWIHAVRYNMRMTVMMFDNNIYGLTKMQSSPTSRRGQFSYTHPRGVPLDPLNPVAVTLSVANVSFVAQTVDWNAPHLYATLREAHRHPGFSFVRILQRCPHYTADLWEPLQRDPSRILLLTHPDGVGVEDAVQRIYQNRAEHDPADLDAARDLAGRTDVVPIGLFYRNPAVPRYDGETLRGVGMGVAEKVQGVQKALDRFLV